MLELQKFKYFYFRLFIYLINSLYKKVQFLFYLFFIKTFLSCHKKFKRLNIFTFSNSVVFLGKRYFNKLFNKFNRKQYSILRINSFKNMFFKNLVFTTLYPIYNQKQVLLNTKLRNIYKVRITFTKRNVFFVLSSPLEKVLKLTTIRKEGFFGRRRKEFTSLLMATRSFKRYIRDFSIVDFDLILIGWSRYRYAIKKALMDNRQWLKKNKFKPFNIYYTYYKLQIPHNGCRLSKKKNRKRIKWKRFFKKSRFKVRIIKKKTLYNAFEFYSK